MKKRHLIMAIGMMLLAFTACSNSNETPTVYGTWIIPNLEEETGFTLEENGKLTLINIDDNELNAWEQKDDLLLLGKHTDSIPFIVSDTLWIDTLTLDRMVVTDLFNNSFTYERKK